MDKSRFKHFVEGDRVYLRDLLVSDIGPAYHRWMNDSETTQYLESRFGDNSLQGIRDFVSSATANSDIIFFAIISKDDDKHIGNVKIGPVNHAHKFADVGIMIGEKDYWGKGFATETIKLIISYAFNVLKLHKLNAGCYELNKGSENAFKKAGFVQEGIRKKHFKYNGKFIDELLFGLVNPNWVE